MTIVKRQRDWAFCKFVNACDDEGRPYPSEWRRYGDLVPISDDEPDAPPVPVSPRPAQPKDVSDETVQEPRRRAELPPPSPLPNPFVPLKDQPVPNEHTRPAPGSDDPLKEPARPERARRPVDRLGYSSAALAAAYVEASGVGFDLHSPRLSESCLLYTSPSPRD